MVSKKLMVALAALSVAACIVQAQNRAPTASEALKLSSRRLELADGLQVVLEQAPDFGAAAAALVVGSGSAEDPPDRAGLAHLTEHLGCSASHGGVSFWDWIRNLDHNVNAYTSWDETMYFAMKGSESLDEVLTFLYGVVHEPLAGVSEAEFRREWHAVSNERRLDTEEGTPDQAVGWLMSATFPADDPYGRPTVGTAESLARLSLDDVRAFTAAHYTPANSTLVIASPRPLDEQQALIEKLAGGAARVQTGPGPRRVQARAIRPTPPTKIVERVADVPTPTLWIGWMIPSTWDATGDIAPLLARIAEISAWHTLDRRDDDIGHVKLDIIPGNAASLLYAKVALKAAAHPSDSVRVIAEEMAGSFGNLAAGGESLDRLTRFVGSDYVYREEGLLARTRDTAHSIHELGIPTFLSLRGERMWTVTPTALKGFVTSYLTADRAHAVLILPRDRYAPPSAPAPEPPSFVRAVATAVASQPAVASTMRPPAAAPPVANPVLGAVETHVLANGLTVILLPRPGSPFHTAVLGFRGGRAHASPSGVTTATDWSRQWSKGAPEVFGIDYRHWVDDGATMEQLRSTGSDVALTLKHLHALIGFSVFWPPKGFNDRIEVYERETQAPEALLERALAHATFGAQPLGSQPSAKEIQRIRPAEVLKWVDKVRRPSNAALVIVGDIDPKAALAAARAELEEWGGGTSPGPIGNPAVAESIAPTEPGQLLVEHRPGSQQATVHIKCLMPQATPATYPARMLFANTLQKTLLTQLREQLGGSYSVGSDVDVIPGGTAVLRLTADVDYAALPQALRQMRQLMAGPGLAGNVPEEVRRATAGHFRIQAATTPAMANRLFDMWNLGWPLDTLDHLRDGALAVTADELTATAANCRDNWVIGLLGDERRLRAAWAAAGN